MRARRLAAAAAAMLAASVVSTTTAAADTGDALPPTPAFDVGVHLTDGAKLAPGLFFIDPHQTVPNLPSGPEIVDNRGRVVWYDQLPSGESASNFRVQTYHGKPVLTWWQGSGDNPAFGAFALGIGQGEDVMMDDHYRIIRTIPTTSEFTPDSHEFQLTPQGNALITGYRLVPHVDLTSVGGSADGTVVDSLAREVSLRTGKVRFTWSALAHVPLTESHALPLFGSSPWDFFHINSISEAPGRNILISARHMWALYDINPRTGDVVWTLGGKHSSFTLDPGAAFAWQHDPRFVSHDEIQLFDDEAGIPFEPAASQSRALWLHLNYRTHMASAVRQIVQPSDQPESDSQGSVQTLPDGNVVIGWGSTGTFSEYNAEGQLLLNDTPPPPSGTVTLPTGATIPNAWSTYRAFKQNWTGIPDTPPAASVHRDASGKYTVSAAWNGATLVARWVVLTGPDPTHLQPTATADWNGLTTPISVTGADIGYIRVAAIDSHGDVLAQTDTIPTS